MLTVEDYRPNVPWLFEFLELPKHIVCCEPISYDPPRIRLTREIWKDGVPNIIILGKFKKIETVEEEYEISVRKIESEK